MEDYIRIFFCIIITISTAIVNTILIIDAILNKENSTLIILCILAFLLTLYYFISSLIGMIKEKNKKIIVMIRNFTLKVLMFIALLVLLVFCIMVLFRSELPDLWFLGLIVSVIILIIFPYKKFFK